MSKDNLDIFNLPFRDKLYRYALNIVGDPQDAEDIMQELLIKIWKRKEQYEQLENKEAWCMTVTRNMAIDKTRSRKVRTDDIDAYFNIKDKTPLVDLNLEQKERMNSILKLLNDLPEQQRQIIHLRDVEGYTYKEIAEITENSLDFVKVSLHRARKNLKEALLKRNFKRHDN